MFHRRPKKLQEGNVSVRSIYLSHLTITHDAWHVLHYELCVCLVSYWNAFLLSLQRLVTVYPQITVGVINILRNGIFLMIIFLFKIRPLLLEMPDVIPLSFGCPMTTTRKGRRYLATVARGSDAILRGDKSDVKLEINKGCPKRAYLMEVRTDLSNFRFSIPNNECFISPIVEVLAPAETSTSSYILRLPHCLDEDDDKTKVKVRMIHENRNLSVVLVPHRVECSDGVLFYDIDSNFIELHTTHFTTVACTICQTPFHCLNMINSFLFAKFNTQTRNIAQGGIDSRHDVVIRPYFCGVVQGLMDFREVI